MPTIDSLVEGKQIGTIKVTRPGWGDCWFRPCYVTAPGSGNQWWYGLRENGVSACYVSSDAGWELWQEPAATRCEDCDKLKKERDDAIETLRKVRAQLGVGEWTR